MAKRLLGKEVNEALVASLQTRAAALREKNIVPTLAIVRLGENPSDLSYEKGATKRAEEVGVAIKNFILPETASKDEVLAVIDQINADDAIHGCLMFRPLPKHLKNDLNEICNRLDPKKDVDSMTHLSNAGIYEGRDDLGFPPCTAQACIEILDHYGYEYNGKRATVMGRSLVIGRPITLMLQHRNCTVTTIHTRTKDPMAYLPYSDLIICAAGVLNSIRAEHVRPGQTVIDVSMNWNPEKITSKGKGGMSGDCAFDEVEPIVEAITPVPGGVGAVTTTVLMKHVIIAAERG
ncbi:MAG: bifunctional 5,10-methylenetetrahydrofolate dehydrogenase/5,10-methenyltetrahydrofolate cyclohydrolase [Oscillospiraceae bacterium]|nr:bifunctional 5,10-methylenetetrahydrofolate dehydrogenase/5,10-methenyltetrahydrofolate cyclohydrolase [Oscillospiraceae bacterium]